MATVYGANRTKVRAVPSQKINQGEAGNGIQFLYDEYTFPAAAFTLNDIIEMQLTVPAGARIVEAAIICPSTGTTGIFELGTAADSDALVVAADAGGQAVKKQCHAGAADLGKKLSAETNYQVKCTEAADAASGLVLQVYIAYVKAQA